MSKSLELKLTQNNGRGVFAINDIKKGELIIADKAIASIEFNIGEQDKMIDECVKICKVGGILALRMSHLWDGIFDNLYIPPISIYT